MANFCVNVNTREFGELFEKFTETGSFIKPLNQKEFAGLVSAIMEERGNLEHLPSITEIDTYVNEKIAPRETIEAREDSSEDLNKIRNQIASKIQAAQKGTTAEKHVPKEIVKVKKATQFIGQGIGSTGKYSRIYGEYGLANTGRYSSEDIIFVASNGRRKGRFNPVINEELQGHYKNIDSAIEAGASFIMDAKSHLENTSAYNIGEVALAKYLEDKGYQREGDSGLWTIDKKKSPEITSEDTDFIPQVSLSYTVDPSINKGKNPRLAKASKDGTITIAPVSNPSEIFDHLTGKKSGIYSVQKKKVLEELTKRGYGISKIKSILNTAQKANDFLILHEREHIFNNDFETFFKEDKNLMSPTVVELETRATINALEHIISDDYVSIYQGKEEAKGVRTSESIVTGENLISKERTVSAKHRRPVSLKYKNNIFGKDASYTQSALKYMNAQFFNVLENMFADNFYQLFDPSGEKNSQLYTDIISETYNELVEHYYVIRDKFIAATDNVNRNKYDRVMKNISYLTDNQISEDGKKTPQYVEPGSLPQNENFAKLVSIHADYLKQFGLDAVISTRSEDINIENTEKNSAELWFTESLKFNFKETASAMTRLMFQDIKDVFKARGIQNYNMDFGTYEFVDSGKMFAVIGNLVANSPDSTFLLKRLQENSGKIKGVDQLLKKLFPEQFNPNSPLEPLLPENLSKADFMRFSEFTQAFSKHKNPYYYIELNEEGRIDFRDAVVNSISKKILTRWHSNSLNISKSSPFYVRDTSVGKFLYNTERFRNEFYPQGNVDFTSYFKNNRDNIPVERQDHLKRIHAARRKEYQRYYDHLNLLSNVFGIEVDNSSLPSEDFYNSITSIVRLIAKDENRNILGVETDSTNYLKPIINHTLEGRENDSDNSFQNGEGETQYGIQYNSYLTIIEDSLNSVETREQLFEMFPHFKSTFSKDSVLLGQMLFDKEGNRVKNLQMNFIDVMKSNETRTPYNKLSIVDKISFMFNSSMVGIHPFFRAGDNSIETAYQGFDFVSEIGENAIFDKVEEYLVTEIKTFREFKDESLPEIRYSDQLDSSRSQFIDVLKKGNLAKEYNRLVNSDETVPQDFIIKFRKTYEEYISSLIEEAIPFLEKHHLISREGNKYVNRGIVGLTQTNVAKQFNEKQLVNVLRKMHLNRAMWNFEQTKLFTGHPGLFKDADDFFKRMSGLRGPKNKSLVDRLMLPAYEKHFPRAQTKRKYYSKEDGNIYTELPDSGEYEMVYNIASYQDVIKSSSKKILSELKEIGLTDSQIAPYSSMTESDAIGIAHIDFYRDLLLTSTMWTEAYEMLYRWSTKKEEGPMKFTKASRETVTISDRNQIRNNDGSLTVFPMIKPQEFGVTTDPRFVTDMYKLAVIPIVPSAIGNRPNMRSAQEMMVKDNIDMITFPSANKKGEYLVEGKKPELYNDKGEFSNEYVPQTTLAKYWGIQLDTRGTKDEIRGSQVRKIIMQNIADRNHIKNPKLAEAVEKYLMYHEESVIAEVRKLKKDIGIESLDKISQEKLNKIINVFLSESKSRNAPNNVVESIGMLPEYVDKGFGLDLLANRDKIEQILVSIGNNRVIKNSVNGFMAVQAPQTLWESEARGYKYTDTAVQDRSEELEFDPKTGTMEIYVNHKFKEILGDNIDQIKIDESLLETVGFRIPTSGINSIERIKIKAFLPDSYGDIVILPSEIVAKAGSDFDVDKLNILLHNYKPKYKNFSYKTANSFIWDYFVKGKTNKQATIEIYRDFIGDNDAAEIAEQTWDSRTPSQRKQDLQDALKETREDGLLFQKLIKEDTPIAREYKEKHGIGEIEAIERIPPGLGSRKAVENGMLEAMIDILTHTDRKNHVSPIGIDLFKKAEEKIVPKLKDALGKGTFGELTHSIVYNSLVLERNMSSKMLTGIEALQATDQTLGQIHNLRMVNAPLYFEEGTYNKDNSLGSIYDAETTNQITELLNQSLNAAVDGVSDPVFFNLNINMETAPVINYLIRRGVPFEKTMTFINQPAIRDYVLLQSVKKSHLNKIQSFLSSDSISDPIMEELSAKYGEKVSQADVTWKQMEEMLGKEEKSEAQMKLVHDFIEYANQADVFGEYILASRLDTQTATNTSEIDFRLALVDRLLSPKGEGQITIENVEKVFQSGTYIGSYYKALKAIQSIYKPFFLHSRYENSEFGRAYKEMLDWITSSQKFKYVSISNKVKILDKFKTDYVSSIILNNPVTIYDGTPYGIIGDMVFELMTGDNSVAKRVMRAQETSDNPFLESLVPALGEDIFTIQGQKVTIDNLKMFDQRVTVPEQNNLTDAYRDLFYENHQLAKDITALTMLQSGLKLSPITFTKYIPAEVYTDMFVSAFDLASDRKVVGPSGSEFIRQFFVNNFKDDNLVPNASWKKDFRNSSAPPYPVAPSRESFIYKYYDYVDEYKKANRQEKEAWESSKRRKFKSTPNIIVKSKNDSIGVFASSERFNSKSLVQIDMQAITDFGTSTSLLAYRDPIVTKRYDIKSEAEFQNIVDQIASSEQVYQKMKIEQLKDC